MDPIRFTPQGPDGWLTAANEELATATLLEGAALGRDHIYFQRGDGKLRAGIWRSEAYSEWYDHYPCDEFMVILEGHVFLENEKGSHKFEKGDAFLVPKGFRGTWRQPVFMLKYYVIAE